MREEVTVYTAGGKVDMKFVLAGCGDVVGPKISFQPLKWSHLEMHSPLLAGWA